MKSLRFLQAILFSLGIHLLLVWSSRFLPPPGSAPTARSEMIEFDVVDGPHEKQFTREVTLPDQLLSETSEDPLRFASETTRNVKKQMRARVTGKTENRALTEERPQGRAQQPDLFSLATGPSGSVTVSKNRPPRNRAEASQGTELVLPRGLSTVGERLPDELEMGDFTALNTDKYLFYSFFGRVDDLIRDNWLDGIRSTLLRTPRGVFQAQNTENWISHVDIQLKPNGEFHKAVLLKSSSIEGFDWAALSAFERAKIFPNPPRELVEEDGYIHLRYSFTVRYRPKAVVRRPE